MAKSSDDRLSLFLSKRCLRGRVVMFAVTLRLTLFTLKPYRFQGTCCLLGQNIRKVLYSVCLRFDAESRRILYFSSHLLLQKL